MSNNHSTLFIFSLLIPIKCRHPLKKHKSTTNYTLKLPQGQINTNETTSKTDFS